MRCPDPRCTGHHANREWAILCPRAKESGKASRRERERRRYEKMSWFEHHAAQLRSRRIRAVQRMERRMGGPVQGEG